MLKNRVRSFASLIICLIIVCSLISGCGGDTGKTGQDSSKDVSNTSDPGKTWILKYDYYSIENSEPSIIDKWYFDEVAARSDGRIEIEYYWAGALRKTGEHYGAVRDGLSELSFLNYGYYSSELPVSRGVEWKWRPGLESPDGLNKAINRLYDETEVWQQEYENANMKVLYMSNWGAEACLFKEPIMSIDQLKGLKARTYGIEGDVMKALGAIPLAIANNETYTSIESGVIDCVTSFGLRTAAGMRLHEQAKHVVDIGSGVQGPSAVVINLDLWNEFPQDIRDIFMEVREELIDYKWAEIMNNTVVEAVTMMIKDGAQFHEWPEEVVAEAAAIAVPMQEEMWINDMVSMRIMTEKECKDFLAKLDQYAAEFAEGAQVKSFSEVYKEITK
ncbi:MAG: TRAP transporter substrate-binding protein DctP [Tepidanaerobacteraceae bacterium]|nr:TRAP transporter substrate-binding protein DctP [Tepidanaerobacteraceae bacterium]